MKIQIQLISLLMAILLLLSSCQSIYDVPLMPHETTVNPDIDLEEEYYTTGMPYYTGDIFKGILYEGCLIYIETCTTTGITGYSTSPEGEKTNKYGDVQVDRIVKYNPVTGTVSSPCLDPACNHSLESGCPMLLGAKGRENRVCQFKGIFDDWLVYLIKTTSDEYSVLVTEVMYNLKTGEARNVHVENFDSEVISRWTSGLYFDGKYYTIKCIMDYSNTGYKPGRGQSLSDFQPTTRRFLYEYSFDTNTSRELFEIGEDWSLGIVSNERFYFRKDDGTYLSIKKDGTSERKEIEMGSSNLVGTYNIFYITNGYNVYDLKTNEFKEVAFDHAILGYVCVTDKGILSASQTKYDEWKNFSIQKYQEEHPGATREEAANAKKKLLSTGSAQIWQCGYMGEDNQVIFELPAGRIEVISACGDYVFAKVSRYNPETGAYLEGYDNKTCCINVKTGEITPIPELEIVVPYWYVN